MDFELSWGGRREDLLVKASGIATPGGLGAYVERVLADPRWRPPMRVILDYRDLDWCQMDLADIEERAEQLVRFAAQIGRCRIAVVTSRTLDYGLLRMKDALLEDRVGYAVAIFRSLDEARQWLWIDAPVGSVVPAPPAR